MAFADIYVLKKGKPLHLSDFKKTEGQLALIDLAPDGDIDCIWIDIFATEIEQQTINLIEEFNL